MTTTKTLTYTAKQAGAVLGISSYKVGQLLHKGVLKDARTIQTAGGFPTYDPAAIAALKAAGNLHIYFAQTTGTRAKRVSAAPQLTRIEQKLDALLAALGEPTKAIPAVPVSTDRH